MGLTKALLAFDIVDEAVDFGEGVGRQFQCDALRYGLGHDFGSKTS
jgi:hypothetical protein